MVSFIFLGYFEKNRISGPTSSVLSLSAEINKLEGFESFVYSSKRFLTDYEIINGTTVFSYDLLVEKLNSKKFPINSFFVFCGIYDYNVFKASLICVKNTYNYIVSPRSNLTKDSLSFSYFKKKLALFTYTGYLIKNASSIHFLSHEEKIKSLYVNNKPYFICPNGVAKDLLMSSSKKQRENLGVFVGRLDVNHKGLDILLDALEICAEYAANNGWKFEIYGTDVREGYKYIKDRIDYSTSLGDICSVHPPILGSFKAEKLHQAKLFLHPSRYEGLPQAVIEGMSCGCIPVITRGCNLDSIVSHWIKSSDISPSAYAELLLSAMQIEDFEIISTSIKGYMYDNFDWKLISRLFVDQVIVK